MLLICVYWPLIRVRLANLLVAKVVAVMIATASGQTTQAIFPNYVILVATQGPTTQAIFS